MSARPFAEMVSSDHEADVGRENGRGPAKRKRPTLSCLQCKNRKVKCDKTKPCKRCRNRDEAHLCEYEEGHSPAPPSSARTVPAEQLEALQRRLDQLENIITCSITPGSANTNTSIIANPSNHITPSQSYSHPSVPASLNTPQSGAPTPAPIPAKESALEQAFSAIDDLSEYGQNARPRNGIILSLAAPSPPVFTSSLWPNILSHQPINTRPPRWLRAMQTNLESIPDRATVERLVNHYFTKSDFFWHHVHQDVFREELAQFHSLRETDQALLADPGWITLLIAVLCVACHTMYGGDFTSAHVANKPADEAARYDEIASTLDQSFDSALLCAGALHTAQFRVLQALLVILNRLQMDRPLNMFEGASIPAAECLWLDLAISIAKGMRLHILGPNFEREPPRDAGYPAGKTLYAREMSARALHALAFWDQVIGCVESDTAGFTLDPHPFRFPRGAITTPRPGNIRDCDLYATGSVPGNGVSSKLSVGMTVKTEVIWQIHVIQIASAWANISFLLHDVPGLTIAAVDEMDRDLSKGMQDLAGLRESNYFATPEDIVTDCLTSSYCQRLIRLHRHFFLRSYVDPMFAPSRMKAISAARQVLRIHTIAIARYGRMIPIQQSMVFYAHTVSATVILFVHGCLSPPDRSNIKQEIFNASELFDKSHLMESVRWEKAVKHGARMVKVLLETLEDPPTTIERIERFLIDLRQRAKKPMADDFPTTTTTLPDALSQTLSTGMGVLGAQEDWMSNGGMGDLNLGDFDWDSLFRGF